MIEAQNYALAQAAEIGRHQEPGSVRTALVRNSRVLIGLTFLGSAAAFAICLCMAALSLSSIFPLHAINFDRAAAAFLWAVGAWIVAASNVFLWRQGRVMAHCSVLLDNHGAHFKLGDTNDAEEVFMPWNGIAAVHHKRIPDAQKFVILGKDTSIVTFTPNNFYRPRKLAHLIAARAGLPVLRG
jgi:hypothetical protein